MAGIDHNSINTKRQKRLLRPNDRDPRAGSQPSLRYLALRRNFSALWLLPFNRWAVHFMTALSDFFLIRLTSLCSPRDMHILATRLARLCAAPLKRKLPTSLRHIPNWNVSAGMHLRLHCLGLMVRTSVPEPITKKHILLESRKKSQLRQP